MRDPQPLGDRQAADYLIHAMLSANSYHSDRRVRFDTESLGWDQIKADGTVIAAAEDKASRSHPLSRLAYDIYRHRDTGKTIFAFRGTDSKLDYLTSSFAVWPFDVQYLQAVAAIREYRGDPAGGPIPITATGHSLGGGLALGASVRLGIPAVVFDSSPRVFDGLGDHHAPASRVCVFEKDEVLERIRAVWHKFAEVVSEDDVYQCDYAFGRLSPHRMDVLARFMLQQAAKSDRSLKALDDATPWPQP